jgi:zinc transport system substrate-binding protein
MKKIILFIILVITVCLIVLALPPKITNITNNKIKITTSIYPLYYFASEIAGDKAVVHNITPYGSEPHDYDLSARDIVNIEKGDLFILNGNVESWGNKVRDILKETGVTVLTAGDGLFRMSDIQDSKNNLDPHIWLDPVNAKIEVHRISETLIQIDSINKQYYRQNTDVLLAKLDSLQVQYEQGLGNCKQQIFVTSHAAFGYVATRYNLKQISIAGLSPDAEPSASDMIDIVRFVRTNNVKYIFFESLVSPKLAQTIAAEAGAQTLVLDPIEGVSDDDIKNGKNYYTIMQENLKNLQLALQCKT